MVANRNLSELLALLRASDATEVMIVVLRGWGISDERRLRAVSNRVNLNVSEDEARLLRDHGARSR